MEDLIILGASGAGRELFNMAIECDGFNKDWRIKGFLDDNIHTLDDYANYPSVIGDIENYNIEEDDVFICSIGSVSVKKRIAGIILARGGRFINLIHPKAVIGQNCKIGIGSIIASSAILTCDITIGSFVTIQSHAVLGHDVSVGDFGHIGANTFLGGFASLGESVTIHPAGSVLPGVKVGEGATVGIASVVLRNIPSQTTVFGMPAMKI